MDPFLLVYPEDRPIAAEQIRRRMTGEVEWAQYHFRGLRKNGELVHCEALGRYSNYQGEPVILGNMVDITDRVRAEEALHKSEESLRRLTTEADRRLEFERARIARELHDGLGQVLTALNMNLAWMGKRVADVDAPMKARLTESVAYVGEMTTIIRSLCKSLHPVVLDHHGLAEAIRSQVADFRRYSQIHCSVTIRPADLDLPRGLAIAVFRIIQEALTNVARHSRATRCWVSLRCDDNVVTIAVRDDGCGNTPARLYAAGTLGILGMKERATVLGGEFKIETAGPKGLRVIARLPVA